MVNVGYCQDCTEPLVFREQALQLHNEYWKPLYTEHQNQIWVWEDVANKVTIKLFKNVRRTVGAKLPRGPGEDGVSGTRNEVQFRVNRILSKSGIPDEEDGEWMSKAKIMIGSRKRKRRWAKKYPKDGPGYKNDVSGGCSA